MIFRKKHELIKTPLKLAKQHQIKDVPLDVDKESLGKALTKLNIAMIQHSGIGIAAPQIGLNYKLAIIDPKILKDVVIINPSYEAVEDSEMQKSMEGCLSVRNSKPYIVERPKTIRVRYHTIDEEMNIVERKDVVLDYPASMVFQHETDHLNGITINKIGDKIDHPLDFS